MAYDNPELKRTHRHTVRFRPEDEMLISVLANRLGVQKATLIQSMALLAAEKELQKLTGLGGMQQPMAIGGAARC